MWIGEMMSKAEEKQYDEYIKQQQKAKARVIKMHSQVATATLELKKLIYLIINILHTVRVDKKIQDTFDSLYR